jgi:hypothetical protein
MERRSLANLHLDRRLIRRRGWISRDELERELSALPDVSSKIAPIDDAPREGDAAPEAERSD